MRYDIVVLFETINKHRRIRKKYELLISFTRIFIEVLRERENNFEDNTNWESEINNGYSMTWDRAKQVMKRKTDFPEKYKNELLSGFITVDDLFEGVEEEIVKFVKEGALNDELRYMISDTPNSSIPRAQKDELLSYENFNEFLTGLIIYTVLEFSQSSVKSKEDIILSDKKTLTIDPKIDLEQYLNDFYQKKIKSEVKTSLSISTKVWRKSDNTWVKTIEAKNNELVHFQIYVENTGEVKINEILVGEMTVNNLVVRNILPENVEYIKDSTVLYNTTNPEGISVDDTLFCDTGMNIGRYNSKGDAYIRFSAIAKNAGNSISPGTNISQISNQANTHFDTSFVIVETE